MSDMSDPGDTPEIAFANPNTELASNRTALAFERTHMAADRTQLAILRTALALIGFGFTIYKFFNEYGKANDLQNVLAAPARNFGLTLVVLGIGLLLAGLRNYHRFLGSMRARRDTLHAKNLLAQGASYQATPTAIVCVLLLLAGILVMLGILVRAGPFA
jgi:putative membrane protein